MAKRKQTMKRVRSKRRPNRRTIQLAPQPDLTPAKKHPTFESPGVTGAQVERGSFFILSGGKAELDTTLPVTYATLRALRKDPTIALARAVAIAPAAMSEWAVESDENTPDDVVEFISEQFLPRRTQIMDTAIRFGHIDFGWQAWEKVFALEGERIVLKKLKPLLHDLTTIVVDETGAFAGFRQPRDMVEVPLEACLLVSFRTEGTQWHGQSLLENARKAVDGWNLANDGATRYDAKVAGAHFLVKAPQGKTKFGTVQSGESTNASMTEEENRAIGESIIKAIRSSDAIVVPKSPIDLEQWEIDLISEGTTAQASFTPRLEYLDKLKVRAILVPERAALEARFGTRADAESHGDTAIAILQLAVEHITTMINWHCVDQLLALNWGEEARGSVWLTAAPMVDAQLDAIRSVYDKLLSNPGTADLEAESIDTDAMKDMIGIPKVAIVDRDVVQVPLPENELERAEVIASLEAMYENRGNGRFS